MINEEKKYLRDEVEIDLSALFRYILKKLKIIFLITIVVGLCMFVISEFVINKSYSANAIITIIPNETSLDYTSYLKSSDVLNLVSKKVGVDADSLSSYVNVIQDSENTFNYTVLVTTNDAKLSSKIANSIVNNFKSKMTSTLDLNSVTIVEQATPNYTPVSPNVKKNTMLGFAGGFIISFGVIVIRFLLDKHLKNATEVENFLGVEVLAEIPYKK